MTDNRLLFWTVFFTTSYWLLGQIIPGPIVSSAGSLMLLAFGGVTLVRYLPEAWKIVLYRHRNPTRDGDGSHLAAYGVTLLSAGSVYVGLFGLAWVIAGQPTVWLSTPISAFGRYIMAAGFGLLFFSPDVSRGSLRLPNTVWLFVVAAAILFIAFLFGVQIGRQELPELQTFRTCPEQFPVKGNRSMIYHNPTDRFYNVTIPEACFATQQMAKASGYRAARTGRM